MLVGLLEDKEESDSLDELDVSKASVLELDDTEDDELVTD